jgi:hypothetical protein
MTIDAIATLFHARSLGRGRYVVNCPAHEDRSPALASAKVRMAVCSCAVSRVARIPQFWHPVDLLREISL